MINLALACVVLIRYLVIVYHCSLFFQKHSKSIVKGSRSTLAVFVRNRPQPYCALGDHSIESSKSVLAQKTALQEFHKKKGISLKRKRSWSNDVTSNIGHVQSAKSDTPAQDPPPLQESVAVAWPSYSFTFPVVRGVGGYAWPLLLMLSPRCTPMCSSLSPPI